MPKACVIKEKGRELGFELVGIVPAKPVPDADWFLGWLDRGFAATMDYLKKGVAKRGDPEKILPGVQSIVCLGMNYYVADTSHPISRYAWGKDYHKVLGARLEELEKFIQIEIDPAAQTRRYVDTGPVLERSYAAQAGLGWIGKNTCLINNGGGSFFFLGEILTTLQFDEEEYDRPVLDQCGTCTRCLDACPTGALPEPYLLDANRCLSYLTVEHKGDFTEKEAREISPHLYGCDICQEVCPYNDRIPVTPLPELQPQNPLLKMTEQEWDAITEEDFRKMTKDSAMNRIRYSQWRRNLLTSLIDANASYKTPSNK